MNSCSIRAIDPSDMGVAHRIVEIQRAAYAVEAELIGFDGIPQLSEVVGDVATLTSMQWRGAFDAGRLIGVIAWTAPNNGDDGDDGDVDVDRLAVDPNAARRGVGRRLVQSVPNGRRVTVSTGAENAPACSLYASEGFARVDDTEIAPGVRLAHFERR